MVSTNPCPVDFVGCKGLQQPCPSGLESQGCRGMLRHWHARSFMASAGAGSVQKVITWTQTPRGMHITSPITCQVTSHAWPGNLHEPAVDLTH